MQDIKTVKIEDADYPVPLKKLKDAPRVLYYQGALPAPQETLVAVVGTRRPSPYGQQATLQLAGQLADGGFTIVSGLAPGIDTYAHKICVEKNKRTIAVLGTGLDEKSIYPQQNILLARSIIREGGCLISEFPPGTHGSSFTFPKRNRIVSALSLGVVVIEAKEKSGSLITATYAQKQGKKVFAVPGHIFTENAKGTNGLIQKGARLVQSAADIAAELGIVTMDFKNKDVPAQDQHEKLIATALEQGPISIDKIIEDTKLGASAVSAKLALMEISGTIRNLGGGMYSL